MAGEPSVLPLSATMISPRTPARWIPSRAASMQRAIVSASFRQGMTMLNSTESATAGFYSNRPGVWRARVLRGGNGASVFFNVQQAPGFRRPRTPGRRWELSAQFWRDVAAAHVSRDTVLASGQIFCLTTIHSTSSGSWTNGWSSSRNDNNLPPPERTPEGIIRVVRVRHKADDPRAVGQLVAQRGQRVIAAGIGGINRRQPPQRRAVGMLPRQPVRNILPGPQGTRRGQNHGRQDAQGREHQQNPPARENAKDDSAPAAAEWE